MADDQREGRIHDGSFLPNLDNVRVDARRAKKILRLWYLESKFNTLIHDRFARRYYSRHRWLSFGNIFFAPAFLFLANVHWVYNLVERDDELFSIYTIVTGIVGFGLFLVTVMIYLLDYKTRADQSREAINYYARFEKKAERYWAAEIVLAPPYTL